MLGRLFVIVKLFSRIVVLSIVGLPLLSFAQTPHYVSDPPVFLNSAENYTIGKHSYWDPNLNVPINQPFQPGTSFGIRYSVNSHIPAPFVGSFLTTIPALGIYNCYNYRGPTPADTNFTVGEMSRFQIPIGTPDGTYNVYSYAIMNDCYLFGNLYLDSNLSVSTIKVVSVDPIVDLSIGSVTLFAGTPEADGVQSVSPKKEFIVEVLVSGSNFKNQENRAADLQLTIGSKVIHKSVSLADLSSGSQLVEIPVKLAVDEIGKQEIIVSINSNRAVEESDITNNAKSIPVHVLCKTTENLEDVPWFTQFQAPWGSTAYANNLLTPKSTMASKGCLVTSLAMLFNFYGLTSADGSAIDPGVLNKGLINTQFSEMGDEYKKFNGFTDTNDVQVNGVITYSRNAYFLNCLRRGGEVESCLTASRRAVSYKGSANGGVELKKRINEELCNGNPVVLKVPSISAPDDPRKAHFVLAKAMSVSADGTEIYIVNDPGSAAGQGRIYSLETVKGYRLYRPTDDPSMIFFHFSGDVDAIVTDPLGRRAGYDPLTQTKYSEIPGGKMFDLEGISDPNDAQNFNPFQSRFEGLEPSPGLYKIKIIGAANANYKITQYSFDSTGTINGISEFNGTIKKNEEKSFSATHSETPLPTNYGDIKIIKADFFDTRHKDMAFLSGKISFRDGRPLWQIGKELKIQIGAFSRVVKRKDLLKYSIKGKTHYAAAYGGKNAMIFDINIETGEFTLFLLKKELNGGVVPFAAELVFQIDSTLTKTLVTFKKVGNR